MKENLYLEGHVLEKVSSTVVLGILSAAAGINEDTNSGSFHRGVRLGGNREAILERGDTGARNLGSSRGSKRANGLDGCL